MPYLAYLAPAVVIPVFLFLANMAWRNQFQYPLTAAADLILAIIAYDLTVLFAPDVLHSLITNPNLSPYISPLHGLGFVLGCLFWYFAVHLTEPSLENYYSTPLQQQPFPLITFLTSWTGAAWLVGMHILFFLHSKQ